MHVMLNVTKHTMAKNMIINEDKLQQQLLSK